VKKRGNAWESNRALLEAINRAYADSPDPDEAARRQAMRGKQRPLVDCAHEASSGGEVTPERVADALLEEEAERHRDPLR